MESLFDSIRSKFGLHALAVCSFSSTSDELVRVVGSKVDERVMKRVAAWPRHRLRQGEVLKESLPENEKLSSLLVAVPVFALNSPELAGVMVAVTVAAESIPSVEAQKSLLACLQPCGEVVLSLERYLAQRPPCARVDYEGTREDAERIAATVANLYDEFFRKRSGDRDRWEQVGRALFKEKVALFVNRRTPISFVLPAFPCKSRNARRKVSGVVPDKGELLALERLVDLVRRVERETSYPATAVVVSDGRVFADLVRVDDELVTSYSRRLRELGSRFKELTFFGLEDAFSVSSHDAAREKLMAMYGASEKWINDRLRRDADFSAVFVGLVRFMMEDFEDLFPEGTSKSQRRKHAANVAKKMVGRNEAYSNLVEDLFPFEIRLSIHPHSNVKKFGFNLVHCESLWRTPWHSVTVRRGDGSYELMLKSQALELGFRETADEDGLVFFE